MVILGLDHVDQFGEIVRHHEAGTIPPPVMWGACPTLFDPSQAPPGRHTAFMWEKLPYRRARRSGELGPSRRASTAAPCCELWQRYAPNLADAVIDTFTRTPLDIERCLPNMREGDLLVGAFANDQVGVPPTVSRAPAPIARTCRDFISAARAAIRAATSPGFRPTTPRR